MRLPETGDLLENRYRVDGVLGEGGFGVVYVASDLSTHTVVAVKVLKPIGGEYDDRTVRRFRREVDALRKLRSPHTVRLLEGGTSADGLLYAVFEHIEGTSLSERLGQHGPLDPAELEVILEQVLQSLGEAHDLGVLHRDLKPENIMVFHDVDGPQAKLLDFGIARSVDDGSPSVTRTGEIIGTPRYMSPEQLTLKPLTPASDLYSLGLVGIEMALGRDGLHGPGWHDQLERLKEGHAFDASGLSRVLRPVLVRVLVKMCAREPAQRYASAAAALRALRRGTPENAPTNRLRAPTRRRRGWWAAAAILGIAVSIGVVGAQRWSSEPPPTKRPVLRPTPTPPPQPEHSASDAPPAVDAPLTFGGCEAPLDFEGTSHGPRFVGMRSTMAFSGFVPPDAAEPMPVLLVLRDKDGASASDFIENGGFADLAEAERFIVIVPHDLIEDRARLVHGRDRLRAFVRELRNLLCVDSERIFVVGHGSGAKVVERMVCDDWVAGVAISSHSRSVLNHDCDLEGDALIPWIQLTPMLSTHHVPGPDGRACNGTVPEHTHLAYDANFRRWHRCRGIPEKLYDGAEGRCDSWQCETPYAVCHMQTGHHWAGGGALREGPCDGPTKPFPRAEVIWRFFSGL